MRIGIDHYSLYPIDPDPLQTLAWARLNGADGVAFSGLGDSHRQLCTPEYLRRIRETATEAGMYLEWGGAQHIPWDLQRWVEKDLMENNRRCAIEATHLGTNIIRSCSGGLMRWNPESRKTEYLIEDMAKALLKQRDLFRDYGVILAIETHFEFTTFELLRLFEQCDAKPGDWLGVCLDTMNLLTMLEDPVMATERILPWVVSTHIKDGGLIKTERGFRSFTAPVGEGVVDMKSILRRLIELPWEVNLNIEDHGGDFDIPIGDPWFRREFPDLNEKEERSLNELAEITKRKMAEKKLSILSRSDWPLVWEERLRNGMAKLREMEADIKGK